MLSWYPPGEAGTEVLATAEIFQFENFRFDQRGGGLFREAERDVLVPVAIGSRALDVLSVLVERPGELVSKNQILDAVWPGTAVEENNLTVQISALRRILDRGRADGSCIQTVAGRGYRFIKPVARRNGDVHSASHAAEHGSRGIPRLSIVVLPFTNLSNDPRQEYVADAITDDLTTDLSWLPGMFVISRNTAFTFRGKPVDTRDVGRDLGVRYVLEGSVRPLGNRVRINAQLIDAETGAHLWAERFDIDVADVSALQDEVTRRIAIALNLELVAAEAARPTGHPDAVDYVLRARALIMRERSYASRAQVTSLYERALALDPHSVEVQLRLANHLISGVLDDMSVSPTGDVQRAKELLERLMPVAPRSALLHLVRAQLLRLQLRYEDAIPEYEAVLALNQNDVSALVHLGICKFMTGSEEETVPLAERAIRLSPRDPMISNWYYRIGLVHLYQCRASEAIGWLEKACRENSNDVLAHWTLAAAYGHAGDRLRAAAALTDARKLDANDRYATIEGVRTNWVAIRPDRRFEDIFLAGLRNAGLPEK